MGGLRVLSPLMSAYASAGAGVLLLLGRAVSRREVETCVPGCCAGLGWGWGYFPAVGAARRSPVIHPNLELYLGTPPIVCHVE